MCLSFSKSFFIVFADPVSIVPSFGTGELVTLNASKPAANSVPAHLFLVLSCLYCSWQSSNRCCHSCIPFSLRNHLMHEWISVFLLEYSKTILLYLSTLYIPYAESRHTMLPGLACSKPWLLVNFVLLLLPNTCAAFGRTHLYHTVKVEREKCQYMCFLSSGYGPLQNISEKIAVLAWNYIYLHSFMCL